MQYATWLGGRSGGYNPLSGGVSPNLGKFPDLPNERTYPSSEEAKSSAKS
jgi:hypothetical protein